MKAALDELLTRTRAFGSESLVIVRPAVALVMYSYDNLARVMAAAADVVEAYLGFVPAGVIVASYEPPLDEHSPDGYVPFDAPAARGLLGQLRVGPPALDEDEGYGFELSATSDGQAGGYGVSFGGIDLANADDADSETSMLQLDVPWPLPEAMNAEALVDFFERVANLFPFCAGNAGLSFNHTVGYTTPAWDEAQKLLPRFLGFDATFGSPQLAMRGKSPGAHWLNFLGAELVDALGGEERLRAQLSGCELRKVRDGLLVRAARLPPVVDVNRGGPDVGRLPVVSRTLRPVRFDSARFSPLPSHERARAWLRRFDERPAGDWDNT